MLALAHRNLQLRRRHAFRQRIEDRLRVDSTGSTAPNPYPSRTDALTRFVTANSQQRGRGASPSRLSDSHSPDPAGSWWGSRELLARPWHEPPVRKKSIPPAQAERWQVTRAVRDQRFSRYFSVDSPVLVCCDCRGFCTRYDGHCCPRTFATRCRFSRLRPDTRTGTCCAHASSDMGYPAASRRELPSLFLFTFYLLVILQTNCLACLRLTERCADILLSIREEIQEAGDDVGIELMEPITRLVE